MSKQEDTAAVGAQNVIKTIMEHLSKEQKQRV
jgi:hypothetical protein